MRRIQSESLQQLLNEIRFTPTGKKRKQLAEAERLLEIIEKDKEYPFEFICYRITGYQPKRGTVSEVIKGEQLSEDLRTFIAKLSGKVAEPVITQKEKVYSTEELAGHLRVSTKTISRWRRQGLNAKKYIFSGGVRRLGFSQTEVDKFLKSRPEAAARAGSFRRLTGAEKKQIIMQAVRLASKTNLSRHQIIRQIAEKSGRCHETIRYILARYDADRPEKRISRVSRGLLSAEQAAEVYRLFKSGEEIEELKKRFGRGKSTIYRATKIRRAIALLGQRIEYISSNEFSGEDAEKTILSAPAGYKWGKQLELKGGNAADYQKLLKEAPVLNRQTEVELFRRYNYLKYSAAASREGIKPSEVSSRILRKIERNLAQAELVKETIIKANLRLVAAIARKHTTDEAMQMELVSDGVLSLMKAVEKFDYTKGFRFGTYASWIITKAFAGKTTQRQFMEKGAVQAIGEEMEEDKRTAQAADFGAIERARQSLVQVIRDNLDEREQYVIVNHFGLVGTRIRKEKKTLQQIGEEMKLSKERVRQIELTALQKLRQILSIEEFELLTE